MAARRNRPLLLSICLAMCAGLLLLGLWPFNFAPINQVTWLQKTNGVHFDGYGQIYATTPATIVAASPLSVEIWLRSLQAEPTFSAIMSMEKASQSEFQVAQSGTDLMVQGHFLTADGTAGIRQIFLDSAFTINSNRLFTLVSSAQGTTLYLDGVLQKSLPDLKLTDLSGAMAIGHSPSGNQPWTGDLLGLAVYRRTLSRADVSHHYHLWSTRESLALGHEEGIAALYPVDEGGGNLIHNRAGSAPDLMIPDKFYTRHKTILEHSFRFNRSGLHDIIVNVVGFIPFGFLVAAWLQHGWQTPHRRSVLLAVMTGTLTSLLIELLQVYLPSRDSSLIDVISNAGGTTLGAIALGVLPSFLTRPPHS